MPRSNVTYIASALGKPGTSKIPRGRTTGSRKRGQTPPVFILNPKASDLPVKRLRFALEHWAEIRGDADCPTVDQLDPTALGPLLGWVMLVDVVNDGHDFIYRLYPSELVWHYDEDLTGRRLSTLDRSAAAFLNQCYQSALAARAPLYARHDPADDPRISTWHKLIVPLVDSADGNVVRFMVTVCGELDDNAPSGTGSLVRYRNT